MSNVNVNEGTTVRRTSEEVKATRLERQQKLAAKAQLRKERLEAQLKTASEKIALAKARQEQIESNTNIRTPKVPLPTIKESVTKRVQREITAFMKELGAKNDLNFDAVTPRVTRQGSGLSFHISGTVAGVAKAIRGAAGATREAARFAQFHKLVGIKQSLLNKEVQLAGETGSFKVLGLKGRAHDVVLQNVGTEEIRNVPADEFKNRMVTA